MDRALVTFVLTGRLQTRSEHCAFLRLLPANRGSTVLEGTTANLVLQARDRQDSDGLDANDVPIKQGYRHLTVSTASVARRGPHPIVVEQRARAKLRMVNAVAGSPVVEV